MNTPSPEQIALRGLLLVVVEVQNLVRAESDLAETCGEIDGIEQIRQVVESAPTAELVLLARAALESPPTTRLELLERAMKPRLWTIDMSAAWNRAIPNVDEAFASLRSAALGESYRFEYSRHAVPAAAAGVHA